ncbi:MAG: hypothetical protein FD180_2432 [Planctomycetota bacterium]|nr:MAG: hypothetical protein FD180_2432 [Planctomycetota bacterium]
MKTLSLAAALAICGIASAQDSLEARRDSKLASEFLKKAPWMTDYDKAREESKKSNKPILAYFSRSFAP